MPSAGNGIVNTIHSDQKAIFTVNERPLSFFFHVAITNSRATQVEMMEKKEVLLLEVREKNQLVVYVLNCSSSYLSSSLFLTSLLYETIV